MNLFVVNQINYHSQRDHTPEALRALSAFNRINALSCIKSAEHGWLGASYSIAELLTVLYFRLGEKNIVLSKGHAAAMQYACLYGKGMLSKEQLLSYKNGPRALQAHTDLHTPGILINTGSLGQALSKTAALALCRPKENFFVIVGDGELQEGQIFEGLQTVVQRKLRNLVILVDRNRFQTELPVEGIKEIPDLDGLFTALGLEVLSIDGHDLAALAHAFGKTTQKPKLILAETQKAGGSRYLLPQDGKQPWHAKVPDDALYLKIIEEQVDLSKDPALAQEFKIYLEENSSQESSWAKPAVKKSANKYPSTRDAFSQKLEALLDVRPEMVALDADLAHSCGLEQIAHRRDRFFEMGIAEQDMVSFAGGLALSGKLPVVHTYASFYKRAYEQMFVNLTEGTKILYAGHYAGLDYHTDGVTHQSISDLRLMTSLPGMVVIEPVTPWQTENLLEWAVSAQPRSVYFRLRRTPMDLAIPKQHVSPEQPMVVGEDVTRCFVTTGTVSTRLALACIQDPMFRSYGLIIQSVFNHPLEMDVYRRLFANTEEIITIEEDLAPGTLHTMILGLVSKLGLNSRVMGKSIDRLGASFRRIEDCLAYFDFTVDGIKRLRKSQPAI